MQCTLHNGGSFEMLLYEEGFLLEVEEVTRVVVKVGTVVEEV